MNGGVVSNGEERIAVLLLSRHGEVWGVPHGAVVEVVRQAAYTRVLLAGEGGELVADEVLGVAEGLRLVPPPALLRRFWGESVRALTVHGGVPLVIIDHDRPPPWLCPEPAA